MSNEYDNDQVIHPDSQQPSGEQGANTSGYYHYTGDTVQDSQTAAQPAAAQPAMEQPAAAQPEAAPQNDAAAQNSAPYQQNQPYGNGIPYQQPQNTTGYQASNDQTQYPNYGGGAVPPTNPMSGYNVGGSEPPKKKKGGVSGKAVVAVALVCALLGGAVGGGAALLAHRSGNSEDNAVLEASESEEESSANDNSVIRSKTIDVTTNSTSTKMTPQDVYENYVNAVVLVYNQGTTSTYWGQTESQSSGSGMIISKDGYVLTNNHVVEGAEKLTVMTTSGEEYDATVIGADEVNDVALLKIEGDEDFPTVSIGDSDQIEVGEQVCAIGNPLGELTNTLTVGYVSALDREISESSTGTTINMFQTDCAINSGNSGGPIFDMNGNVVGITTAKYSSSGYSNAASVEGIGFCIPINDAMSIVNDLMQYGYVYVAQVAMGADQAQTLKALREAESYDGPSIVICYCPCLEQHIKAGMGTSQDEMKKAVECGYWHLYRYDPRRIAEGKNPFQLDSKEPDTSKVMDFLMGENRFASLKNNFPERADALYQKEIADVKARYQKYRKMAED